MTKDTNKDSIDQPPTAGSLLSVSGLKKYYEVHDNAFQRIFGTGDRYVRAIDDIDFEIHPGEIFCLVGESGCGKSTTARVVTGLEQPTEGNFYWKEEKIQHKEIKPTRKDVKTQIVFQDPYSSLNPRMTLGDAVLHPLVIHKRVEQEDVKRNIRNAFYSEIVFALLFFLSIGSYVMSYLNEESALFYTFGTLIIFLIGLSQYIWFSRLKGSVENQKVLDAFEQVGLSPPKQYYHKYPHEISGGERQRVNIARAIILNPDLLVLDEPTSMLDVSLRAGILDLLKNLQEESNISMLFITHDLAVARHFGDKVGVMYVGEIVETGEVDDLFRNPHHPYTKALIDAIPSPSTKSGDIDLPKGEVADAINPPSGCRFHPRCAYAEEKCSKEKPRLNDVKGGKHDTACFFPLNTIE